ncbi:MAG TPA: CDP-archaeol synthase [Chlamydiales bacterium]|mgnify:CR=1 FL=1|nr:CDP-archaeol synthase [Chlamydiales bacterium]
MNNSFQDLSKRLVSSIFTIGVIGLILVLDTYCVFKPFLPIAIAAIGSLALWEYIMLAKDKQIMLSKPVLISFPWMLVLGFYLENFYPQVFSKAVPVIFFFYILFVFVQNFHKVEGAWTRISCSLLGMFYLALPLALLIPIIFINHQNDGRYWLIYLVIVTKTTDIFAYFGGRLFGKHPLAKILSPKKTWEGGVIGILFAILVSYLFSLVSSDSFQLTASMSLLLGFCFGVGGQIGDLTESLLKRDAKVKDSNVIPGIGGILDMVDSLLINIFILYFVLIF